jgi:peptidoglycan/LPS O-acetylase OafA/YrhL
LNDKVDPPVTKLPAPAPVLRHRYPSLDGLRGAASFVVLICHSLIIQPALLQAYIDPRFIPRGSQAWWFTFSPLHLPWAGMEMVYLFFILSGFVLALPFTHGRRKRWAGYYPKRFLRLYPPAWGAFALALFWITVFPRHFSTDDSIWLQVHPTVLESAAIRADLLLIPGPLGSNSVLWTLRYEVLFSLLLPLLVFLSRRLPKLNLLKAAILLGVIVALGKEGDKMWFFLSMFFLGTLMAVERDRLARIGQRIRMLKHSRAAWWGLTIFSLLLLNAYWTVGGLTNDPKRLTYLTPWARGLSVVASCMIIFLAVEGTWCRQLEKPALQWLGKRTYSLYLVHEPLVVLAALLLGGRPSPVLTLLVVIPSALVVTALFYAVIEGPSQRLSRAVGAKVDRWRDRGAGPRVGEPVVVAEPVSLPDPTGIGTAR